MLEDVLCKYNCGHNHENKYDTMRSVRRIKTLKYYKIELYIALLFKYNSTA